jgi:hypothetical protein
MSTSIQDYLKQINRAHIMGVDQDKPHRSAREVLGEIMCNLSVNIEETASKAAFKGAHRQ